MGLCLPMGRARFHARRSSRTSCSPGTDDFRAYIFGEDCNGIKEESLLSGEGDASPLAAIMKFLRQIHDTVNNMLSGKLNATLDVTLTAASPTTVIVDPRLSGSSYIGLGCPLTASAAVELGAGVAVFQEGDNVPAWKAG